MTRIFVQRGSVGSSSNANRPPSNSVPQPSASQAASSSRDQDVEKQVLEDQSALDDPREPSESGDDKILKHDDPGASTEVEGGSNVCFEEDRSMHDVSASTVIRQETREPCVNQKDSVRLCTGSSQIVNGGSYPPPPPAPPPKRFSTNLGSRRTSLGSSNTARISSLRRQSAWPGVSTRSPSESRPSSPRSYGEGEGYNSADEQGPCYASSFDDSVWYLVEFWSCEEKTTWFRLIVWTLSSYFWWNIILPFDIFGDILADQIPCTEHNIIFSLNLV